VRRIRSSPDPTSSLPPGRRSYLWPTGDKSLGDYRASLRNEVKTGFQISKLQRSHSFRNKGQVGCRHNCRTGSSGQGRMLEDLHGRSQRSRRPSRHRGASIAGPIEMQPGFNTQKEFLGFGLEDVSTSDLSLTAASWVSAGQKEDLHRRSQRSRRPENAVGTGVLPSPDR
jgi:hypothetical protein